MLPNITRAVIWLYPVREEALPTPLPAVVRDDMQGYNELELVVYGAVELGDVVLTFVGIHGLTGLEVYARLGWHFD